MTAEQLIAICQGKNIKTIKHGGIEIEFFPKASEPMALDPVALSKVLTDSMPPDSAMLFAATEGIVDPIDPNTLILNPSEGNIDPMA